MKNCKKKSLYETIENLKTDRIADVIKELFKIFRCDNVMFKEKSPNLLEIDIEILMNEMIWYLEFASK